MVKSIARRFCWWSNRSIKDHLSYQIQRSICELFHGNAPHLIQTNMSTKNFISEVLSLSENQYHRLYSIGKCSVIENKINSISLTAIININCFNCGFSPSLKYCPKTQNKERIKANKKIFYEKIWISRASQIPRREWPPEKGQLGSSYWCRKEKPWSP